MSRGNAFSGVAPQVHPVPGRGANAFYGGRLFRNQIQSQGFGPAYSNPAIVVHFFARERAGWRGGN
jgi:hypothetical protein